MVARFPGMQRERQGRLFLMTHDVNDLFRLLSVMEERQKNHQRDFEQFKKDFNDKQEAVVDRIGSLEQTRTKWATGATVLFALGAASDQIFKAISAVLTK
jgi:endo-1,4-beta-D-glucanase Y